MKTFSFLFAAAIFLLSISACKKCFTCTNECATCILTQGDTLTLDTKVFCSDSGFYKSKKASLEAQQYKCSVVKGNYVDDFCVNNEDAEDYYLDYHGKDRYNCVKK